MHGLAEACVEGLHLSSLQLSLPSHLRRPAGTSFGCICRPCPATPPRAASHSAAASVPARCRMAAEARKPPIGERKTRCTAKAGARAAR